MAATRCPMCNAEYADATGQLAAFLRLAGEGRLAMLIGCGSCHRLYAPVATGELPDAATPPAAPRYQPLRELGRGGMGVVYLAYDSVLSRQVCMKRLHHAGDLRGFRHEWQALARLDHPSIVRLLDVFETDGAPHLVMEVVDGRGLDAVVADGALAPALALDVARQLCDALDYAHGADVIHRDIKPQNVLLEQRGARVVARVLDFGLALVGDVDQRGANTGAGQIAGTPLYMAPEQVRGEEISAAADVYAVGVTLAELLTGSCPFRGNHHELVERKLACEGVEITGPPAVVELIWAMTRRDPSRRPTARDAAARLVALVPALRDHDALAPLNLRLDRDVGGWFDGAGSIEDVSSGYHIARAGDGVLELRGDAASPAAVAGFGTAMQRVAASHLAGRTVTLAATLEVTGGGWASPWLRADGPDGQLALDNGHDHAVRAGEGWATRTVELALPPATTWLCFGAVLAGGGSAHVHFLSLACDGRDLAVPIRGGDGGDDDDLRRS